MGAWDKSPTILVVDDNVVSLESLYDILDAQGYKVIKQKDASYALDAVQKYLPDLILLDVMMPVINGFAICSQLQSNSTLKDIPVVFMTAITSASDKIRGFNVGAVDYITKPFNREELLARVSTHIKLRQLNLELTRQKEKLEEIVQERTANLTSALAELQQAHREVQQTQLQLIQSEKMSSIGQLVAGVAHEINNPVGFIAGNLQPIKEYTQDLFTLIALYQECYPNPQAVIQEHIEAIDLDYLREDLPRILNSMKEGTNRIRSISVSLRTFSRADSETKVSFNIHEGIDSTILILKHRLKGNEDCPEIEIIKNYGDLPMLQCFPGQLNQVFMNVIANAIDALEEYYQKLTANNEKILYQAQIKISTELISDFPIFNPSLSSLESKQDISHIPHILIRISDNGPGMSRETQERIFENLFTTKPVGKGTGLGLSIAKQIVEDRHGGELSCVSELGKGTEFFIKLPI